VQLPEDDDPASLLLKGQSLDDYIQKSLEIFSFFIESLGVNFQQKTLSEKILLAEKIVAVVANINDAFRQDLLLSQAAMVMGLPFESLKNLLGRQKNRKFGFGQFASAVQTSQPADTAEPRSVPVYEQMKPSIDPACSELNLLEERLFSAILNGGLKLQESMRLDEDLIPYFSNGFKQLIVRLYGFVQNCKTSPGNSDLFSSFLDSLDQNEKDLVIKLSMKYDAEISKDSFDQLVFKFCKVNWKYIVQGIKDEMSRAKEMNDTTRLNDLLVKFLKLRDGMQTRGLI
jgi:DNA primase